MQIKNKGIRYLVHGAVIAAVYAALSLLFAPISYGLVQVRVSEALTILPMLTPAAVPGLFVGCAVANLLSPMFSIYDLIFGSLATLIAAVLSYLLRRHRWLVPLPPVVVNALVVGYILSNVLKIGAPFWACALFVAGGQLVACYGLGIPISYALSRVAPKLFGESADIKGK